ncbi:hypothetical protein MCHI_001319 [Candidatus Magnetoovum chiemensis]|nr:hypothetical protein MCHI_001319 [Candidatus Magnetoovum chiemensis]
MRIIIEIEKDEDIEKIKSILYDQSVTIRKQKRKRDEIILSIFNRYNMTLPENYKLNRNDLHER